MIERMTIAEFVHMRGPLSKFQAFLRSQTRQKRSAAAVGSAGGGSGLGQMSRRMQTIVRQSLRPGGGSRIDIRV